MKTHTFLGLALASLVALPACTGSKQDVTEDFSDLAGLDDKSDAFSYRMKIVGSLDYGQTSDPVRYNRHPRFRAFKFAGDAGDQVDVWVRSADGDPIAWVLDDSFRVIGSNDDADGSTFDSHIQLTLPEHPSRTHYIVFRDYWLHPGMFTVELQGSPDYYSCTRDADCEKIQDGCCPHNGWVAVNTDHVDAYREALGCPEHPICPLIATPLDESMPQCNLDAGKCELVQPEEIACGGRSLNPHVCPDGWSCVGDRLAVDAPEIINGAVIDITDGCFLR